MRHALTVHPSATRIDNEQQPIKDIEKMQCTTCGSDNTQRLSVAYQNGTQVINTRSTSVGAGFGSGGAGLGSAATSTTGTSTSLLAARAAPPAKKRYRTAFILPVVMWIIAIFFEKSLLATALNVSAYAVLAWLLFRTYQFNARQWPQLYQHWQSLWICHKCGTIYSQE